MPRVTRAQAEAAMNRLENEAGHWASDAMELRVLWGDLRAYLAQRPDEDTVRKGHKALESLDDLALEGSWTHESCKELTYSECVAVVGDYVDRARAAMYQPEEEA